MDLQAWVKKQGYGEIARIAQVTGLRWATVYDCLKGHHIPRGRTAALISEATGGAVTLADLCLSREDKRAVKRRMRAATRRKRSRAAAPSTTNTQERATT